MDSQKLQSEEFLLNLQGVREIYDIRHICCDQKQLLSLAKRFLETFMLENFCGYAGTKECKRPDWDDAAYKELTVEGSEPYKFTRSLSALLAAKLMLIDNGARIDECFEKHLLRQRCALLWQNILNEPIIFLKSIIDDESVLKYGAEDSSAMAEVFLEKFQASMLYSDHKTAKLCLEKATNLLGLEVVMTGKLGKRTKYQQNDTAQLFLEAVGNGLVEDRYATDFDLPRQVPLHDDVLLETVSFLDGNHVKNEKFPSLYSSCVLANSVYEWKTEPDLDIMRERCTAYLNQVISHPTNWAVQTSALLQRSDLERRSKRRVDRACEQLEIIVKDVCDCCASEDIPCKRLNLLLASGLRPYWLVERLHADILLSLGCVSEALSIYEMQEDWDSIIQCYQNLRQLDKAENLIRSLISKDEKKPKYHCLLGEITQCAKHFEKAIEISNGRYSRAYRSLGMYFLHQKCYKEAYANLKKFLRMQPINPDVWFNLGCCAWKLGNLSEASRAYRECVRYTPEYFQAWNNLAAVYEKCDDADRAKKVIQEALKINFDHAKLWENYMLLCLRTHDYKSAIASFHHLLDIDKTYKDENCVEEMAKGLLILSEDDRNATKDLVGAMCELLGRYTAQRSCSSKVWSCYAQLKKPTTESQLHDHETYVHLLERAFRTDFNKFDWFKSENTCSVVLKNAYELAKAKCALAESKEMSRNALLKETRLTLLSIVKTVENTYGSDVADVENSTLKENLRLIKQYLILPENTR